MRINLSTPLSDDKEMQRRNEAVLDAIEQYTEERMTNDRLRQSIEQLTKDTAAERIKRREAMDNLIAQDADLIDAQTTQNDGNFHKLPLSESFERVVKVAKEREAFNEEMALREALTDLLHAVCGRTGFAETVRRDSGRIYPWPALDLAEAKARAALEQGK